MIRSLNIPIIVYFKKKFIIFFVNLNETTYVKNFYVMNEYIKYLSTYMQYYICFADQPQTLDFNKYFINLYQYIQGMSKMIC